MTFHVPLISAALPYTVFVFIQSQERFCTFGQQLQDSSQAKSLSSLVPFALLVTTVKVCFPEIKHLSFL